LTACRITPEPILNDSFSVDSDSIIQLKYMGKAEKVYLAGDISDWNPNVYEFESNENNDVWTLDIPFAKDGRMEYQFVIDGEKWTLDPSNPLTFKNMDYINSVYVGPAYDPDSTFIENIALTTKGILQDYKFEGSKFIGSGNIYLPFGFDKNQTYPLAIFHDGDDYIRFGAKHILDNMIAAKKLPPIVALFLNPTDRSEEYAMGKREAYVDFIVNELLNDVKQKYPISKKPNDIASIGNSFGANISALIAYGHHDQVGLCGSLSGAYWVDDSYAKKYIIENLDKNVKYAAIWGKYEGVWINNQEIMAKMEQNGLKNLNKQVNEGHNWVNWRSQVPQVLEFLFNKS
jgi:enterochelin esterase family protein